MVVGVPLPLQALPRRPVVEAVREGLLAAYEGSPVVRVADDMPAVVRIEDDAGSDRLTLRVRGSDAAGQALLIATLDNLGKGAAGAAVQTLNILAATAPPAGAQPRARDPRHAKATRCVQTSRCIAWGQV